MNVKIYNPEEYDLLPIPNVLYKYRDWENVRHRTIIEEQLVYLSRPDGFEDKYDCNIPVRYDLLSKAEIFKIYFEGSKERNPSWIRQKHREFARVWQKKNLLSDPIKIEENRNISRVMFNNKYGVLCLTEDPTNTEMWEKYSNSHKGFCVGFNGKELLRDSDKFGLQGEVKYVDELPIITYHHSLEDKAFINSLYKLKKWSFEKEYRVSKINYEPINDDWRKVFVKNDLFVEIIFGRDMTEEHKKQIISLTTSKFEKVVYKQAKIDLNNADNIIVDDYIIV
jgi:Protein of unknown function (DUF2971)